MQSSGLVEYDEIGILIGFIGFYNVTPPSAEQCEVLQKFLRKSIKDGLLDQNFTMYERSELFGYDVTGNVFYEEIKKWPNYTKALRIYEQNEWGASRFTNFKFKFRTTSIRIVFGFTETDSCETLVKILMLLFGLN